MGVIEPPCPLAGLFQVTLVPFGPVSKARCAASTARRRSRSSTPLLTSSPESTGPSAAYAGAPARIPRPLYAQPSVSVLGIWFVCVRPVSATAATINSPTARVGSPRIVWPIFLSLFVYRPDRRFSTRTIHHERFCPLHCSSPPSMRTHQRQDPFQGRKQRTRRRFGRWRRSTGR